MNSRRQFQKGDKVIVKGLDMPFVVECYIDDLVKLFIEGETASGMHSIIHARPDVLLLNNTENCRAEGWIKLTVKDVLQMAVDYHTLSADAFEDKYPVRPPEKENEPCWVSLAKKVLI